MTKGKGYFATLTPEQREEMRKKAAATRAAKRNAEVERWNIQSQQMEELQALSIKEQDEGLAEIAQRDSADRTPTLAELLPQAESDFVDDILSPEELAEIRAEAKKRVAADRKKAARAVALADAIEEERRAQGALSESELLSEEQRELVRIYINLPSLRTPTGNELTPDPIIIDQRVFHHNTWHTVERHQADYLQSQMSLSFRHVAQIDGRSRNRYNNLLGTVIYAGGAAQGTSGTGMTFEGIHRRPQ